MTRFYADEDVPVELARLLRVRQGLDAVSTRDVGRTGALDHEQLAHAFVEGRVLVTHNAGDFRLLHGAWRHWQQVWGLGGPLRHAGILILPPKRPPPRPFTVEQMVAVVELAERDVEDLKGRLLSWRSGAGWQELDAE